MANPLIIGLPCNISPAEDKRSFYRSKELHFNDAVFSDLFLSLRNVLPFFIPIAESENTAEKYIQTIDGLFLTGGSDMSPLFYGEGSLKKKWQGETKRPRFEILLVKRALKHQKPILGICQGCQVLNVACGGSLYQDIRMQKVSDRKHLISGEKVSACRHRIQIVKQSRLHRIVGKESLVVNSAHHQAIKKVGKTMRITATAADGIIEAIESTGESFCLGVQWHAEQMATSPFQKKIFSTFLRACREHT